MPAGMKDSSDSKPSYKSEAKDGKEEVEPPLYKTDEFRIFCMKVLPCSKRYCHDWTTCPFAHPGEKARRRDPRVQHYTGIACPDMKKDQACTRGDNCPYAHNVFEYWLHPTRYRTQLCNDGPACKRKVCFFAHSLDQLRVAATKPLAGSNDATPANIADSLAALTATSMPLASQRNSAEGGLKALSLPSPAAAAAAAAALFAEKERATSGAQEASVSDLASRLATLQLAMNAAPVGVQTDQAVMNLLSALLKEAVDVCNQPANKEAADAALQAANAAAASSAQQGGQHAVRRGLNSDFYRGSNAGRARREQGSQRGSLDPFGAGQRGLGPVGSMGAMEFPPQEEVDAWQAQAAAAANPFAGPVDPNQGYTMRSEWNMTPRSSLDYAQGQAHRGAAARYNAQMQGMAQQGLGQGMNGAMQGMNSQGMNSQGAYSQGMASQGLGMQLDAFKGGNRGMEGVRGSIPEGLCLNGSLANNSIDGRASSEYSRMSSDFGGNGANGAHLGSDYGRFSADYNSRLRSLDYGRASLDYGCASLDYGAGREYGRGEFNNSRGSLDYGRPMSAEFSRQSGDYTNVGMGGNSGMGSSLGPLHEGLPQQQDHQRASLDYTSPLRHTPQDVGRASAELGRASAEFYRGDGGYGGGNPQSQGFDGQGGGLFPQGGGAGFAPGLNNSGFYGGGNMMGQGALLTPQQQAQLQAYQQQLLLQQQHIQAQQQQEAFNQEQGQFPHQQYNAQQQCGLGEQQSERLVGRAMSPMSPNGAEPRDASHVLLQREGANANGAGDGNALTSNDLQVAAPTRRSTSVHSDRASFEAGRAAGNASSVGTGSTPHSQRVSLESQRSVSNAGGAQGSQQALLGLEGLNHGRSSLDMPRSSLEEYRQPDSPSTVVAPPLQACHSERPYPRLLDQTEGLQFVNRANSGSGLHAW